VRTSSSGGKHFSTENGTFTHFPVQAALQSGASLYRPGRDRGVCVAPAPRSGVREISLDLTFQAYYWDLIASARPDQNLWAFPERSHCISFHDERKVPGQYPGPLYPEQA
jgi:hypothetical protein